MTIKNEFFDEISKLDSDDNGQFEAYCNSNTRAPEQKSLESTLAFAKEYMKSEAFAKEWCKFCKQLKGKK